MADSTFVPPPAKKRKHVSLTIQQKIDIIRRLERGESRNSIKIRYNIGSSTIYDIKKQKEKLEQFLADSESSEWFDVRCNVKKPKHAELDSVLYKWFRGKRDEGLPITGPTIIEKAKMIHTEFGFNDDCTFSDGWLRNFRVRHGITKYDMSGAPRDPGANEIQFDISESYGDIFADLIKQYNLTAHQIYNADFSKLFWRYLPDKVLDSGECPDETFSQDKLNVFLCANAEGTHRLKPLVIGTCENPIPFRVLASLPVLYKAQPGLCLTFDMLKEWFHQEFVPSVKENFRRVGLPEDSNAILLLDNLKTHPHENELVSENIFTVHLPTEVAAVLQPMECGILQTWKCHYRTLFCRRLLDSQKPLKEFVMDYSMKDAVFNVALAWEESKEDALKTCWKKLWPGILPNDKYSSESDKFVLDAATMSEIQDIIKNIKKIPDDSNPFNGLTEEELEELLKTDRDDDVLFEQIMEEGSATENSRELQPIEAFEDIIQAERIRSSWNEAANHLNKFIQFAERSNFYTASEVLQLHIIQNNFLKKKSDSVKQADIIRCLTEPRTVQLSNPRENSLQVCDDNSFLSSGEVKDEFQ
ncbi:jerky protein homolog [Uloborus diversus]|uniref:jerky protein homolog n=1 Tax=Uloborus diversus TaxID=327109 RepID=UPI002409F65E|nr:jerky protein homolog [Uloborus diversus]